VRGKPTQNAFIENVNIRMRDELDVVPIAWSRPGTAQ
jgi:hypothetical protein